MNTRQLATFAKRLNAVLRHAGWPECEYWDGPRFPLDAPRSDVTIYHHQQHLLEETFALDIRRTDAGQRIYVEAPLDFRCPDPALKTRNDLIRATRRALA